MRRRSASAAAQASGAGDEAQIGGAGLDRLQPRVAALVQEELDRIAERRRLIRAQPAMRLETDHWPGAVPRPAMPAQIVLAGGEHDRSALDPAAVAQRRDPGGPVRLQSPDRDAGAHVGPALPGVGQEAAVEARAREAVARGGQLGRALRACTPHPGARERTGAEPGGREAELLELGGRGPAQVFAADLRPRLRVPFGQHDPQPARGQPGGRRGARRAAADHEHVRALDHGALIRPTA
jgi:hypothetical protein